MRDGDEDELGIRKAVASLEDLVQEELDQGIPRERILIGGFSQGAAVVLAQGALGKSNGLGGIIILSGYMPLVWKLKTVSFPFLFFFFPSIMKVLIEKFR